MTSPEVLATIQKYSDLSDRALAKLLGVNRRTIARHRDKSQSERLETSGRRARGCKPLPETEERGFISEATVYYCYEKPVNGYAVLLYVGCSLATIKRLALHSSTPWWKEIHTIRLVHYPTVAAAVMAETRAIRRKQPRYNTHYHYKVRG